MKVCVIGGGRWSRVLVEVLIPLLRQEDSIIWLTRHHKESANDWVRSRQLNQISVVADESWVWAQPLDAVINATATHSHFHYNMEALKRRIPTLSEKPMALSMREAAELLASTKECPFGVNFEFMYASYLSDLAEACGNLNVQKIEMDWCDPFLSERHGELKTGDLTAPIVHDFFPHCWSILKTIWPQYALQRIRDVNLRQDGGVEVMADHVGGIASKFNFSRYAKCRSRALSVNNGQVILDFSEEPGILHVGDRQRTLSWLGERPLPIALSEFLTIAKNRIGTSQWRQSIHNCLDSVRLAEDAAIILRAKQLEKIRELTSLGKAAEDEVLGRLLVDLFLPEEAAAGRRHDIRSPEDLFRVARLLVPGQVSGRISS